VKVVRAAAYVRVLPAEMDRDGLRPAEQRERLERFIAERGWELAEVREDVGTDAFAPNQPALRDMLDRCAGIDRLVVLRPDHFGGSMRRTADVVERLAARGVGVVSVEDGLLSQAQWPWWNAWNPDNLRKDFAPQTVIDVGVADGTPSLYAAFPDAYLVLVEPLAEYEAAMKKSLEQRRGEYHLTAVGAEEGTATLRVPQDWLRLSSILPSTTPYQETREVPITTLDRLHENWQPPYGLKIDVEGFESQVIEGATRLLEQTQFVIAETSIANRFEGEQSFAQFVGLMDSHGFELCDVLDVQKAWKDRRVSVLDAMFARRR
jgi:FkbM family methyltransferase